nr:cytochrome c [Gemmatimonadota bacterium]
MKRALKWLGYVVGLLVLFVIIGVGTVYAITSSRMNKTYPTEVQSVAIPSDPVAVAKGKHLVEAVGKCTDCHGANLSGTRMFDAAVFMKLTAPNLTSGKGGIPNYTDADWVRAIRHGLNRAGKPLIFMPSQEFTAFSDSDLGAIIAYLKTVPPADTEVEPARAPGPVARAIYLLANYPLIPVEQIDSNASRAEITPAVNIEYGQYL